MLRDFVQGFNLGQILFDIRQYRIGKCPLCRGSGCGGLLLQHQNVQEDLGAVGFQHQIFVLTHISLGQDMQLPEGFDNRMILVQLIAGRLLIDSFHKGALYSAFVKGNHVPAVKVCILNMGEMIGLRRDKQKGVGIEDVFFVLNDIGRPAGQGEQQLIFRMHMPEEVALFRRGYPDIGKADRSVLVA